MSNEEFQSLVLKKLDSFDEFQSNVIEKLDSLQKMGKTLDLIR